VAADSGELNRRVEFFWDDGFAKAECCDCGSLARG
jgi:hypothetical protein